MIGDGFAEFPLSFGQRDYEEFEGFTRYVRLNIVFTILIGLLLSK